MNAREQLAATVVHGLHGQLFHRDHQAFEQVTGDLSFTPEELEIWVNSIETRWAWCKARGVSHRMLIVPEKHVVYSDCLPPGVAISERRPASQILEALSPAVREDCIYPVEALRAGRSVRPTYYATDTHWTPSGAFLTYEMLMSSIARTTPVNPLGESDITRALKRYTLGDLGTRLDPEPDEMIERVDHDPPRPVERLFENKAFTRGSVAVYAGGHPDRPKCVIYRDSFAVTLIPHLIPTFGRVFAIGSTSVRYDLMRAVQPDVVVFQIAERFLGNLDDEGRRLLPADISTASFEEFSGVPLGVIAAL